MGPGQTSDGRARGLERGQEPFEGAGECPGLVEGQMMM